MANNYKVSELVGSPTASFDGSVPLIRTARRDYEGEFTDRKYRPGNSIDYRLDNRYNVVNGDDITGSIQPLLDRFRTIQLEEFANIPIELLRGDLDRQIKDIRETYLDPAGKTLGTEINRRLNADILGKVSFHVGTKGAIPNSFADVQEVNTFMTEYGMASNRTWYANLTPTVADSVSNALNNQFNLSINDPILKRNVLGELAGFMVMKDFTVVKHVSALVAGVGVTVETTIADGATTAALTGIANDGIMTKGTLVKFTGYQYMNPVVHQALPEKYIFSRTLAADATVTSGKATVTFNEPINFTTANANVNAQIIATAPVTVVDNYTANICFVSGALQFVMPPPGDFSRDADSRTYNDPNKTRTIMTLSKQSEVGLNTILYRLDALYGSDWQPEMCCMLIY